MPVDINNVSSMDRNVRKVTQIVDNFEQMFPFTYNICSCKPMVDYPILKGMPWMDVYIHPPPV